MCFATSWTALILFMLLQGQSDAVNHECYLFFHFTVILYWGWTGLHVRNVATPSFVSTSFAKSKNVEQLFLTPQNIMRKAVHYWWLFYVDAGFNLYNVALQHLSQLLDMEQVLSSVSQLRHKDVSLIHLNYRNLFHKFCDFSCWLLKQMELL